MNGFKQNYVAVLPKEAFTVDPVLGSLCADRSDLWQYEPISAVFHLASPKGDTVFRLQRVLRTDGELIGWEFNSVTGGTPHIYND